MLIQIKPYVLKSSTKKNINYCHHKNTTTTRKLLNNDQY